MTGLDNDGRLLQSHAEAFSRLLAVLAKQQCSAPDWDLEKTRYRQLLDLDAVPGKPPVRAPQPGAPVL